MMSDYPTAPPYSGAYSRPQLNVPYPQPSYSSQYVQHDDGRTAQAQIASNYNGSAYAYNNSIPGFSAATMAPVAPLPGYQGWNQDAAPMPSYSTPQNSVPYAGYGYQTTQPYVTPQPPQQTYHQNTQHAQYDEGELSEGEFDAYGSQNNSGVAPAEYGSIYYPGNDGTGFVNTAQRALYPNGQDYNHQYYPPRNEYNNYQRESDEYSPYTASPLAAGQDEGWKGKRNNDSYPPVTVPQRPANGTSWMQSSARPTSRPTPSEYLPKAAAELPSPHIKSPARHNSSHQKGQISNPTASVIHHKPSTEVQNQDRTASSPEVVQQAPAIQTKSVAEYRKKAEGAILNLWSREVRFPDYVEEGLNAEIVGSLFDELGFSKAPKVTAAEIKPVNETKDLKLMGKPPAEFAKPAQHSSGMSDQPRGVLVESTGNNVTSATSTASPADVEPTEKEKSLKMKMEALRKSRAERAQKAATKTNAQPSVIANTSPQPQSFVLPNAKLSNSPLSSPSSAVRLATDATPSSNGLFINEAQSSIQIQPSRSTAQPVAASQPVIPGLFRASTSGPAPPLAISNTVLSGPLSNQRKRPVAADFDTPLSSVPYKRPFGRSHNESLVIDVSEAESDSADEDEDVAMDLDSQADPESPHQAARHLSDKRAAGLQDFPPLTNFPSRRAFLSPPGSSAPGTPQVLTTSKATLGQPQGLQQTERKIEELKKKIAAAEAAKAAKRRAQQASSGAATPHLQAVNGVSAINGDGDIANKVEASLQMQQLIEVAEDKVATEQKMLAETQAAEKEKAAELNRNEAESRRLRRNKIAADLPRVDAEVEDSQRKLQELRDAMAKIEASVQKSMDEKKRMADEMERLTQEAEDQLQEQKDKLDSLASNVAESIFDSTPSVMLPLPPNNVEHAGFTSNVVVSNSDSAFTSATTRPTFGQGEIAPLAGSDTLGEEPAQSAVAYALDKETTPADGCRLYIGNLPAATTEAILQSLFEGYLVKSMFLLKNPRTKGFVGFAVVELFTSSDAERAITELSGKMVTDRQVSVQFALPPEITDFDVEGDGSRRSSTNGVDPFSSSDQALEAVLQDQVHAEAEFRKQSEVDVEGEDSYVPDPALSAPVSSTVSEGDGSPAVHGLTASIDNGLVPEAHLPKMQHDTSMAMDSSQDDENDDYEPPEATPPVDIPSPVVSPPFSPAPPESVTDFEQFSIGRGGLEITDGNEEEVQVNGHIQVEELVDPSNHIQFLTPYESPLKYFRAFRFHPDYEQQVSGGLKSLTYSHRIDPNKEFCQYELAGGVCNDTTCDLQHFRDIALPDDAILSTLGNPAEFPADQQQRFREGLKHLLIELRARNVRDFDTIAAEVLAHRTDFLNDPSKILMLEGTTI